MALLVVCIIRSFSHSMLLQPHYICVCMVYYIYIGIIHITCLRVCDVYCIMIRTVYLVNSRHAALNNICHLMHCAAALWQCVYYVINVRLMAWNLLHLIQQIIHMLLASISCYFFHSLALCYYTTQFGCVSFASYRQVLLRIIHMNHFCSLSVIIAELLSQSGLSVNMAS